MLFRRVQVDILEQAAVDLPPGRDIWRRHTARRRLRPVALSWVLTRALWLASVALELRVPFLVTVLRDRER